jgi:hypothetical protein
VKLPDPAGRLSCLGRAGVCRVAGAEAMTPDMPPVSLPPLMMRLVRQSGIETDCVVASLASLLGLTYTAALVHCAKVNPDVLTLGMNWTDTQAAARLAGIPTRVIKSGRFDLTEATGILSVVRRKNGRKDEHVVLLWAGRICDGNGELWLDPDDYLLAYGYKATSLLVRAED